MLPLLLRNGVPVPALPKGGRDEDLAVIHAVEVHESRSTLERAPILDACESSQFERPLFGELQRVIPGRRFLHGCLECETNRAAQLVKRAACGQNRIRRRADDRDVRGLVVGTDEVPAPAEIQPGALHGTKVSGVAPASVRERRPTHAAIAPRVAANWSADAS